MTDPTITPAQPLPFNEWITRKGSTVPGPDEYRDYVDYANTELLRNGLYDDQLAAEIEQEVATLAAESGVTADLRARRPDQDFDLLTRRAIETGDDDMGNAVRTYQAVKGSRDIYDDEVEYQRKLEEARLAAEPFLDPERVNDARRAALDRGDLPFVVIDQGGDKPPLIQFGPAAADIRTDEDLAAAFDANPDLDRRFIGAVRQKIQPLPGLDAPAWAIDRQMDFQAAAAQTKITDTERYRLMVRDIANGNTDTFDRTLADLSTDPAFASFTQDERRNFLMDMAKMQGQPEVDPQNVAASLRTLSTGQVHIPNAVLFNKGYFDQALQAVPEGQRQTVQAQRQAHMEAVAPEKFALLSEFSPDFVDTYEQAKAAGKSNGEILDEWMSDSDNYNNYANRTKGLLRGVVSAVTDIPISLAALAGSDTARDILVENQRRESARKQYANLFGDKLGIGYDAANLIAPVGVDLTLAAAAGPTGGATVGLLAAKTGAKAVIKSTLRRSLSAETKTLLSQFTRKAAARQATRQGLDTVTTPISTSAVLTLAGRDFAQTASRSATQATVLGTAFTRSAGSTYASLHATLSNERNADGTPRYTPEQVREIALGHGLTAGAITASVVGAFQFLGAAGVERLLSGGFTPAQARQIHARLKLNPEIAKQYGVSLESPEKMIESAVRDATTNFLRAGVEEGGEEFVDQMAQAVNESIATGERFDVVKATKDALYAGALGFGMGAGMTGAQRLANRPLGEDRLQVERRSALLQLANKFDAHSPNTAAALRAAAAEPPPAPAQEDVPAPPAAGGTQQAPSDAGVAPAPTDQVAPPTPPAPLAPEVIERNQREIAANEEEIQKITARRGGKPQQGWLARIEMLQARNAELRQRSGLAEPEAPTAAEAETDPETQDIANEVEQTLAGLPAPAGTPTESLPTDTPTSGDVGTAVQQELPGTEQPRQRTLSGMRDAVNRRLDQMEEDGTGDPTRLTALLGRIEAKMLRDNAEGADAVRARYASAAPGQTVTADAPREVREVMEEEVAAKQPEIDSNLAGADESPPALAVEALLPPEIEKDLQDVNDAIQRKKPSQSPEMMQAFTRIGAAIDPDVRLSDQQTLGQVYAMVRRGEMTDDDFIKYLNETRSQFSSLKGVPSRFETNFRLGVRSGLPSSVQKVEGQTPQTSAQADRQGDVRGIEIPQLRTIPRGSDRAGSSVEGQTLAANRASRTALLLSLNKMVGSPFDENNLILIEQDQIDEIRDWLVEQNNARIRSADTSAELDIADIVEPPAPDEQIVENVATAPAPELAIETPRIRKTVKRKLKSKGIDADGMTDVELAAQVTLGAATETAATPPTPTTPQPGDSITFTANVPGAMTPIQGVVKEIKPNGSIVASANGINYPNAQIVEAPPTAPTPEEVQAAIDTTLSAKDKKTAAAELGAAEWNADTATTFARRMTDWITSGVEASEKLAAMFARVAKAISKTAMALIAMVSITANTTTEANIQTIGVEEVASRPAGPSPSEIADVQRRVQDAVGAANRVVGSLRQTAVSAGQAIANAATPLVDRMMRQADFGKVKPSDNARRMADWIVKNQDNKDLVFVVADKSEGSLYFFSPEGKLIKKSPALFGSTPGDIHSPSRMGMTMEQIRNDRRQQITPAGRFETETARSNAYGQVVPITKTGKNSRAAIHKVFTGRPQERRTERMDPQGAFKSDPLRTRVSLGCINVPDSTAKAAARMFEDGGVVYIMPDTEKGKSLFEGFEGLDTKFQPAVSDTPVARDLQRLGIQDGSAAFLRNVIERGPKEYRTIARILAAFTLPNPTLVDLPDANYAGAFVASTRQILINVARRGPRGPVDTVMHELIHAALEDSLRNPTDAQRKILNRLERIRQTVIKRAEAIGNRDVNYGLSSMDEFFTHFLTSPEFQRQIGAMTPKGQRNWIDVILDALRSLFGAKVKTEADKSIETIWNDMIRFTESAAAEQTYGLSRMDQLRMQPDDLRDLSRFKELLEMDNRTPEQEAELARMQPALQATDPFYSQLQRTVAAKVPTRATPEQIMATIKAAGVKAEEIKWSGIEQALGSLAVDGKVEKAALLKYLGEEGSVRFEEVTLADSPESSLPTSAESSLPKFSQYTLPGGENYREVVLAMPSKNHPYKIYPKYSTYRQAEGFFLDQGDGGGVWFPTQQEAQARAETWWKTDHKQYRSSHFPDVPNYVAHMRTNERDGGLFIEELQSDRGQSIRKEINNARSQLDEKWVEIVTRMKKDGILKVVCP